MRYILKRIEHGREVAIMECDNLDSAIEQGKAFKEGYAVYETKLVAHS